MRAIVNSVDFYHSLSTEIIPNEINRCEVKVQGTDEFDNEPNCEAIEIEIHAVDFSQDISFYATLNYNNALFIAESIISILEIQKRRANG